MAGDTMLDRPTTPISVQPARPGNQPTGQPPPQDSLESTRPQEGHGCQRRLISELKLKYTPDDWQVHLIRRVLQGYDGILCAGTGYGKSLVFEGLAKLGGKKKLVLVISPLKALENDQAKQAKEKGIHAVVLNEDTTHTAGIWGEARTKANIAYISPEMALSTSFSKLWKDVKFRTRVSAVVVDEAHCVEEWGTDDFRPEYRQLNSLRTYTGLDIPFLACTATCSTSTFNTLWDTLGYGRRPFWGLDVGIDRPNLLYDIRPLANQKEPLLDILNFLPSNISHTTRLSDLFKSLLYFNSENDCRVAVLYLRKCLPAHLRQAVQAFSSNLSETAKARSWKYFLSGKIRILCATDAAGMGCNVTDVRYVASFGMPQSVGQICQRWGRAGRDRTTPAVCVLLVPPWVVRASPQLVANLLLARVQGKRAPKPESKTVIAKRAKLDPAIERFVNLHHDMPRGCVHRYLTSLFRPRTDLNLYTSLTAVTYSKPGTRSQASPYILSWTVLDVGRSAPSSRCCYHCSPSELTAYAACDYHDPRLSTFATDFFYPLSRPQPAPPSRPDSSASTTSTSSTISSASSTAQVATSPQPVTKDHVAKLGEALKKWREAEHERPGSSALLSSSILLPPRPTAQILEAAKDIANTSDITVDFIRRISPLDLLSDLQVESLAQGIISWRATLAAPSLPLPAPTTPSSRQRSPKRSRICRQTPTANVPRALSPSPSPRFQMPASTMLMTPVQSCEYSLLLVHCSATDDHSKPLPIHYSTRHPVLLKTRQPQGPIHSFQVGFRSLRLVSPTIRLHQSLAQVSQ
ncbi:hypothetical protein D9611_014097 [Ephemerocybe angulata]|uniref:DNA 3'-5' helicase n=1 Tax=Ephemerocybe angulata TaxID=980116 RepID=A0A8H5B9G4_9AGAR|nr:hypothetical protein D9611_014097 [Tulosesus angulatus]